RADLKLAPKAGGHFALSSVAFATFRGFLPEGVDAIVGQGSVTAEGDIHQTKEGALSLAGDVDLADLALRGKPASAKMRFTGSLNPRSEALAVSIDGLHLETVGTRLGGTASFGTAPPRGEFDLQGDRLDLDTIVGGSAAGSGAPSQPEGTDW